MAHGSLILGTRGSALALWQAEHVRGRLEAAGVSVEIRIISTVGDRRIDVPLASIGEKGLFTRELDEALLRGDIHLAVHSLKDLPSSLPDGLVLAAVPERTHPFDVFVAGPGVDGMLGDVPDRAVLATSSVRRQSQLLAWRPDLHIVPIRGNVDTRLRKLDAEALHGIVLAEAGLVRLGLAVRVRERIPRAIMLPAVGQGALGVVSSDADDSLTAQLRSILHHESTGRATTAERSFLKRLEGGCSVPVAAHAVIDGNMLHVEGCVAAADGTEVVRHLLSGPATSAAEVGEALADHLLEAGARGILARHRRHA